MMPRSLRRPDSRPLSADQLRDLVSAAGSPELFAELFSASSDEVARWCKEGVPAGPAAAALRYFARQNGTVRLLATGDEECSFCKTPTSSKVASYLVCDSCRASPTEAAKMVGLDLVVGRTPDEPRVQVFSSLAFKQPVRATFRRQRFFDRRDPEISDPEFDDDVWLKTDDYEMLFDLLQHPGRREIVHRLAVAGELTLNVSEAVFRAKPDLVNIVEPKHHLVLVLVWSLVHETVSYG